MTNLAIQHSTSDHYSPWDLLPQPEPKDTSYPDGFFYHNVAKHLIKDTVRIMDNGLNMDMSKVEQLEDVLEVILAKVTADLASNKLIQDFQSIQHAKQLALYVKDRKSKLRSVEHYIVPFKYKDMAHRSYFMHFFAKQQNITGPTELLPTGVAKWDARTVKKLSGSHPMLVRLVEGRLSDNHPIVKEAITLLATHKSELYNEKYVAQMRDPVLDLPGFSPASSQQKQDLFDWLDIPSEATSKTTGLPSWDRDQVVRVNEETTDDRIKHFTQCFIEHSFAAIVRNNFIKAFYDYTVDGRLHGQYKLIGAKSGRYTSSNP